MGLVLVLGLEGDRDRGRVLVLLRYTSPISPLYLTVIRVPLVALIRGGPAPATSIAVT